MSNYKCVVINANFAEQNHEHDQCAVCASE